LIFFISFFSSERRAQNALVLSLRSARKCRFLDRFFSLTLRAFFAELVIGIREVWQNKIILFGKVGALYKKQLSCQTKIAKYIAFASRRLLQ